MMSSDATKVRSKVWSSLKRVERVQMLNAD